MGKWEKKSTWPEMQHFYGTLVFMYMWHNEEIFVFQCQNWVIFFRKLATIGIGMYAEAF